MAKKVRLTAAMRTDES